MKGRDTPLQFEQHAAWRMRKRGVSPEQVVETVYRPDAVRPARRPGAQRYEKAFSARRRLAAIAEREEAFLRIVSAWWM